MENFSPVSGLVGGLLIGLAASLLILVNGRIAGISGIIGGAFVAPKSDRFWRLAFVAGLILGPVLVTATTGFAPNIDISSSTPTVIGAGLLVGFGTRLGSGCTSGHGVCGIARGSPRSMAATAVFFAVAVCTVFVMRHLIDG